MEKTLLFFFAILLVGSSGFYAESCKNQQSSTTTTNIDLVVTEVDPTLFINGGLAEPITKVTRKSSNGSSVECYKIVSKNTPTDHQMGPWCPTNISDDASKGGIWFDNGKVYDVDGAFVKNMATFYKDKTWMMYNTSTGKITKTMSKKECQEAANPNVGAEYKNYCVECLPSYITTVTQTIYLPIKPVKVNTSIALGGGGRPGGGGQLPSGPPPNGQRPQGPPLGEHKPGEEKGGTPSMRGIAFNGVRYDAPAPVNSILGAYTLAPFDDAGGHINLGAGYHYHGAMGKSKKVSQTDGHAAMIGYAMDGHGLYEHLDASGKEASELDDCRGHYDKMRGYHYHVDKAGTNNFINCLNGAYAN